MAILRNLAPDVLVAGQITADDLVAVKARGVGRIINNRPDGEEPDQPMAAEIGAAAEALGIDYVYAPARGMPDPEVVAVVEQALSDGVPVLLHCKSGMRSAAAWALASSRKGVSRADILSAASSAGYDLGGLPL